ncbi:MAG TPA: FecR domain-containing protein [Steroidobacteraceae bacterium]
MSLREDVAAEYDESLAEAAEWMLRLRDPAVSQAQIAAWLAWHDASAENQQAYAQMQSLWSRAAQLDEQEVAADALATDSYFGQVPVAEWNERMSRPVPPGARDAGTRKRAWARVPGRIVWLSGSVAAAAIVLLTLQIALRQPAGRDMTGEVMIETQTGANRDATLPDGSQVTIAGGSRLAARYTAQERSLLLERGEAYFRVKKDARRPFVVRALDATVTAVGTAFNVRAEGGAVRVAVIEGAVNVDRTERLSARERPGRIENIRVTAGHLVTLQPNQSDPIIVSGNVQEATSWVSGTQKFVAEPLSAVVAAINRYSAVAVKIDSPVVSGLHYTGTIVADRANDWLRGLPNVFPVVVQDNGSEGVVILPAPHSTSRR